MRLNYNIWSCIFCHLWQLSRNPCQLIFRQVLLISSDDTYENKVAFLKDWVWQNLNSGIPELVECAKTFQHWFQAIRNSLAVPFSNGPIEGKNNKIKVLKRVTYGMKKFVDFKARILLACS